MAKNASLKHGRIPSPVRFRSFFLVYPPLTNRRLAFQMLAWNIGGDILNRLKDFFNLWGSNLRCRLYAASQQKCNSGSFHHCSFHRYFIAKVWAISAKHQLCAGGSTDLCWYQTCTSAYLFDTLVTGMGERPVGRIALFVNRVRWWTWLIATTIILHLVRTGEEVESAKEDGRVAENAHLGGRLWEVLNWDVLLCHNIIVLWWQSTWSMSGLPSTPPRSSPRIGSLCLERKDWHISG